MPEWQGRGESTRRGYLYASASYAGKPRRYRQQTRAKWRPAVCTNHSLATGRQRSRQGSKARKMRRSVLWNAELLRMNMPVEAQGTQRTAIATAHCAKSRRSAAEINTFPIRSLNSRWARGWEHGRINSEPRTDLRAGRRRQTSTP